MRWFSFLFSIRFWIMVLFVGLLTLPPAALLVIVVGFLSHAFVLMLATNAPQPVPVGAAVLALR